MSGGEFLSLKQSISDYGVRDPITIFEGQVLDGRHRYQACVELGIECPFVEWEGDGSLVDFVLDRNCNRRSLTPSQRAQAAVDALPFYAAEAADRQRKGTLASSDAKVGKAAELAARATGASTAMVERAKKLNDVAPEMAAAVRSGEITVTAAIAKTAKPLPPKPTTVTDGLDRPVSDAKAKEALNERQWFADQKKALKAIQKAIKEKSDENKAGGKLNMQAIDGAFGDAIRMLMAAAPFCVCPFKSCDKPGRGCNACKGSRWLTKSQYENLPSELKVKE